MPPESFYLQCPSNASMHIYPKNTLAQYTINLQTPLVLGENYEVGLCEIQYPHSWDNVRRGHNTFDITFQSPQKTGKCMIMEKNPSDILCFNTRAAESVFESLSKHGKEKYILTCLFLSKVYRQQFFKGLEFSSF